MKSPVFRIVLIVFALIVVGALLWQVRPFAGGQAPEKEAELATTQEVPKPPSEEQLAVLGDSQAPSLLVSYTDGGFEPSSAREQQGQAVRFVNNSSKKLWIASMSSDTTVAYPGVSDCGASAFDTCRALEPNEYWQFVFSEVGTWTFQNNVDKEKKGTMVVEAQ